jgi:AAA15 family ATPase/GTPase
MTISKVEIKNFTAFEDTTINFTEGINVLIGENGTGKTHLLKLIYATIISSGIYTKQPAESLRDRSSIARSFFDATDVMSFLRKKDRIGLCTVTYDDKNITYEFIPYPDTIYPDEFVINISKDGELGNIADNLIFIPAKDMLTHSKGLLEMAKKYSKDMPFDRTLLDVIEKSRQWKLDNTPDIAKNVIPALESVIEGKIIMEDNAFFVKKANGEKIGFSYEAEGIKRLGLLWQLLMNESITRHSLMLWDEPEANVNPKLIPVMVEILLELSRNGVQVFAATHDYILAKYFEVKRKENDSIIFHSLYKTENGVKCESNENFRDLKNNSIIAAFDELMDEVINGNLGE